MLPIQAMEHRFQKLWHGNLPPTETCATPIWNIGLLTMPDHLPTPEQLKALADRFGRIGIPAQLATGGMIHSFADAALRKALECQAQDQDRALRNVLSRFSPEATLIKQGPTIGRKRRARRARERRIEARRRRPQPMTVAQWAVGHRIHPSVYKSGHISSGHIGSVFASLQSRAQAAADAALLHVLTGDSLWKP